VIFFWRKRFGMQTVRVPVGRVPQIKHTCEGRKMPVITLMKKKLKRIQKTEIKIKMNATIFKITEKRAHDRQNDSLKLANK
jgi:hypothetical protein